MLKKVVMLLSGIVLVLGGYGCGGDGGKTPEDLQPVQGSVGVERALKKEQAGRPLTGAQRRKLEDAREAGQVQ